MTVGQRLKIFTESSKIRQQVIADMLKMSRQNVSSFMIGRSEPGLASLVEILKNYPELNARWLLTGEGHMLDEHRKTKTEEEILSYLISKKEECDLCQEKDKRIRELERLIEAKEQVIEVLKKK